MYKRQVFYPTGAAGPEGWSAQKRGGHKIPRKAQPSKLDVYKRQIKDSISHKNADLKGQMSSQGPTPRRLPDLILSPIHI